MDADALDIDNGKLDIDVDWSIGQREIVELVIELLTVPLMMLMPIGALYLLDDFKTYNIFKAKATSELNAQMEFIRLSLFFALIYALYIGLLIAIKVAPIVLLRILQTMQAKPDRTETTRMHLYYLWSTRNWLLLAAFLLMVMLVSAQVLYKTSLISTMNDAFRGIKPAEGTFALERLYVLIIFWALLLVFANYLVEIIAHNFHQAGFARRIHRVNYRFGVLSRLYVSVFRGIPSRGRAPIFQLSNDGQMVPDMSIDLQTPSKAGQLADALFSMLCPHTRGFLKIDDIRQCFDVEEVRNAFHCFDELDSDMVSRDEFREAVIDIYEERGNLMRSLESNSVIIYKLRLVFLAITLLFVILFAVVIFDLNASGIVAIFLIFYGGLSFLIRAGVESIYSSLLFLLAEHPYDMGDWVVIDGKRLQVRRIDLFTTVFCEKDGTIVYMSHSTLLGKSIYNIRRSANQCEIIDLSLVTNTPIEKIWTFKEKLAIFAKSRPKDFTPMVEIHSFDILSAKELKLTIIFQYRGNLQNGASQVRRKKLFAMEIEKILQELGIFCNK